MTDYRIVFNEQTGRYRVEQKRWWGWIFVMDESGQDYQSFSDCREARRFLCLRQRQQQGRHRRWRVVRFCDRVCTDC